ncbi:MAG: TPR end-of-group domain-containing protein [Gaiellaceae bacterium]
MADRPFEIARLKKIERSGNRGEWIPIRRSLGIAAFGVNAWSGEEGAELIPEHDEVPTGHEELYLVLDGQATFTVGGETVAAPAGTLVLARDPAVKRGAVAATGGTTILSIGAKPGEAFRVSAWEVTSEIFPLLDRGEYEEAKRRLEEAVAEFPAEGVHLYNLACAEARLGEKDAALDHLLRAIELEDRFAAYAPDDEDLASLRDNPRFPRASAT